MDDSSDLRRGKVTALLLPPEELLERFISDVEPRSRHPTWRLAKKGVFGHVKSVSVCTWYGVTCDAQHRLRRIRWDDMGLERQVQWEFLPQTLTACSFLRNRLTGSLLLDALPPQLTYLHVSSNRFGDELSLTNLPPTTESLWFNDNRFEGSVDLTHLPLRLCDLIKIQFLYLVGTFSL